MHWSRLRLGGCLLGNKTVARRIHVIGVYLLSQSAPEKQSQENKEPTNLCALCEFLKKMRLPCLIIIQSCYFHNGINKSFACSRCVMCISCSVHLISTYYVRKGSWAFFILITHKSMRFENPIHRSLACLHLLCFSPLH